MITRERGIAWTAGAALMGTAWLIDPFAQAGFDAPKRLVALLAAAIGAALLAWPMTAPPWHAWSPRARAIAGCAALAVCGFVVATVLSPQPAVAWDALRTIALFALFVPLGAARALDVHGAVVTRAAIAAVGVNVALSLVQAAGIALPIPLAQLGGRFPTGALLGNEAYVAIAAAMLAAGSLAVALSATTSHTRAMAVALIALAVAAIAVNRQITASIALAAAAAAVLAAHWRLRGVVTAGAVIAFIVVATAAIPMLRAVTWAHAPLTVDRVQNATTYRLGAWAAADEMIAARPWTGFGPGTFATQAQPFRLAAELRVQERLIPPPPSSAFVYAHQDYLQLAAEAGVPVLAAVLAALALLVGGLLRLASTEARVLLGMLAAGAVAALAWFPMQIPFVAVLLLLACGRAWRLVAQVRP